MNKGTAYLLSLLLSAGIWLIYNLSKPYSEIVSVSVLAASNLEGRSALSSEPSVITARCRASGFKIRSLSGNRPVTVEMAPDDFEAVDGGFYTVSSEKLYRYVPEIFGADVTVESFLMKAAYFRFKSENSVRLPIVPVHHISCRSGLGTVGGIVISPDSVTLFGEPQRLAALENVYTEVITLDDLDKDVHGEARLLVPDGIRASVNKVGYGVTVSRYVETGTLHEVEVRNAPYGKTITVLPSVVEVRCRSIFPFVKTPDAGLSCYVDYSEFASSISGHCIVHVAGVPDGSAVSSIHPQVCECFENER